MGLSFNDVNVRGSFTWVKCNDDAKSHVFRQLFVNKHGGIFEKKDRYWEWNPSQHQLINIDSSQPLESKENSIKTWFFMKDGNVVETQNILDFCKKNNLTRSSIYELIAGKKRQHKGYYFLKIVHS